MSKEDKLCSPIFIFSISIHVGIEKNFRSTVSAIAHESAHAALANALTVNAFCIAFHRIPNVDSICS